MPSNNRQAVTPERLAIREKEGRCVELKMAGLSNEEIAKIVGYRSGDGVRKALIRALTERAQGDKEHLRQLEVARCERMIRALWKDVLEGKDKAVKSCLAVMERRAMLEGLDAPQRNVVQVWTPELLREALEEVGSEVKELESGLPSESFDIDLEDDDVEEDEATREIFAEAAEREQGVQQEATVDA